MFLRIVLIAVALTMLSRPLQAAEAKRKPNVIVLLADDLGYGDLGVQGGKDVPTPHIDSLAANGVRCTNGYVSAPVCSPTRAGLMTGRYQQRFGHEFNPALPANGGHDQGLPVSERTLADRLRAAGYVTTHVGKWHLGETDAYYPQRRGFDDSFGFLRGWHNYMAATADDKTYGPVLRGRQPVELDGYMTTVLAREATSFIDRNKSRPFFIYLAFNAVHTPMEAPDATVRQFAREADPTRRTYLAMLKELDVSVGRILAKLRELNLEEDTLIFFLSDNGGPTTKFSPNGSRNGSLRGSKGDTWEGGIRVPFLVQWKGTLPAGKTYAQPVISLDIAATALAAARSKVEGKALDGVNLLPFLEGKDASPPHASLYWRFGAQMAIRQGDWVLVRPSMGKGEYEAIATKPMLFNVVKDVGQEHDEAARQPELVRKLQADWERWSAGLAAPRWPATLRGSAFKAP